MTAQKFRKKPVEIEAAQWDGTIDGATPVLDWIRANDGTAYLHRECGQGDSHLLIRTLEGDMIAQSQDWIIRGVQGEFYPCKPDIFAATYEAVSGGAA